MLFRSKKIHIDIDESNINKTIKVDVPVVGDVTSILKRVVKVWRDNNLKTNKSDLKLWWDKINNWKKNKSLLDDVIKGCVPVYGVYRFGKNSGINQRPRFLGSEGSGVAADASPILQINKVTADFYMAHGDDDFPHLIEQAIEMEKVLKQAGTSIERTLMVGCDHLGAHLATGDEKGRWFKGLLSFMGI